MTQTYDFCCWCDVKVKVPKNRDHSKKLVCSQGCRDAELLFTKMFSDEEQNRRAHYYAMTRGEDYGEE